MVGFLTLKAGCSPHGSLSEATLRVQSTLCVKICGSGKTLLYSEIDEEKILPRSQRKLLIWPFLVLAATFYSLIWSRLITIRESECDPEKHSADPSIWTSFMSTLWPWHYANAAGCWHCRHGLDTIWLLLLCYALTWFSSQTAAKLFARLAAECEVPVETCWHTQIWCNWSNLPGCEWVLRKYLSCIPPTVVSLKCFKDPVGGRFTRE